MLINGCAIAVIMRIEDDAVTLLVEQFGQGTLAVLERRATQVLAIELNKIERAEDIPFSCVHSLPGAGFLSLERTKRDGCSYTRRS